MISLQTLHSTNKLRCYNVHEAIKRRRKNEKLGKSNRSRGTKRDFTIRWMRAQSEEKAEANVKTEQTLKPGSQIKLEGAVNVRDLGGYKTTDGLTIKPHKLIRSAELANLSDSDKKKLVNTYDLSHIVDFRTSSRSRSETR